MAREPRRRKGESWREYAARQNEWLRQKKGLPLPVPCRHLVTNYEPCYRLTWKQQANILWTSRVFLSNQRMHRDNMARPIPPGLYRPWPGNVALGNSSAMFEIWRKRWKRPPLVRDKRTCQFTNQKCPYPWRDPLKYRVGRVRARFWYQEPGEFWVEETKKPAYELDTWLCCVEGCYLYARQIRKEGWRQVDISFETDRPEVLEEIQVLFGQIPCGG